MRYMLVVEYTAHGADTGTETSRQNRYKIPNSCLPRHITSGRGTVRGADSKRNNNSSFQLIASCLPLLDGVTPALATEFVFALYVVSVYSFTDLGQQLQPSKMIQCIPQSCRQCR
jgi:hypothetical protein